MAEFIIAKQKNDPGENISKYRTNRDLRNLLFYCHNHCVSCMMNHLYPFGIENIYYQFLYLQKRRVKPMDTKAYHYIVSFDSQGHESDIGRYELESIMISLNQFCLSEYQAVQFLHMDKPSHYHIHYIVNPVHIYNFHVCRETPKKTSYSFAEILGSIHGIALSPVSYQDGIGRIVRGTETGCMIYQQKFFQEHGLRYVK